MTDAGAAFLREVLRSFRGQKRLAEAAMAQLRDDELFHQLDPEANGVAVIVKHLAGNMRSRWRDFLTSDGEKPDRNRDQEFEMASDTSRSAVMRWWEEGWAVVFQAIEPLTPADLDRTVTIRGHEHTMLEAINRQLLHYAYHVGQIVLLAKHLRGAEWKSLSIPRGQSASFGREAEVERRKRREG